MRLGRETRCSRAVFGFRYSVFAKRERSSRPKSEWNESPEFGVLSSEF